MSTSKEYKAVRSCILNELHLTKEDIIKNIEPLLEKHVKRYMVNTYGGDNQIENWIRCMVNDELKRKDHDFVRKACENVIRDHVLNAYVSASPLSSTWYWSSTESSQAVAWYVVFSSGLTGTGNKHIGDMVRTVIDF